MPNLNKVNLLEILLSTLLVILILSKTSSALYEDQVKKFDWRRLQIGPLGYSHLDLNASQPRLFVSTKENVLASLCPITGEIIWRQVLETGPRGNIKLFQVNSVSSVNGGNTAAARLNSKHGFDILTVQGYAPAIVRAWKANTGHIEWEWSLIPLQSDKAENALWFYSDSYLYHILPIWNSHLEVTQYVATSGQATRLTSKITAPWINAENCRLNGCYYTCLVDRQLVSLDLCSNEYANVYKKSLELVPQRATQLIGGTEGILIIDGKLVSVKDDIKACENLRSSVFAFGFYKKERVVVAASTNNKVLHLNVFYADSCQREENLSQTVSSIVHEEITAINAFDCNSNRSNGGKGCIFLLSTSDESILAIQHNKILWTREEALANIVATEFIDLPLADTEGTLENEIKGNKAGDLFSTFLRRVTTQALQFKALFLHVIGLGAAPSDTQKAGLFRDSFGLHKMLVVLTRCGKIFGIDNISGKHHWQQFLHNVENFANGERMRLIVQRSSKHFPLQPVCTVLAREKETGNGILYEFNPITGNSTGRGLLKLDFPIRQLALLAETETEFMRAILLLDSSNKVIVHPESGKKMADGIYIFTADKKKAKMDGFIVKYRNEKLYATPLWNVHLCGPVCEQEIIAIAKKNPIERVHSQGRVLGDRSVLYKYINPNLVAVFTQSNDSIHKCIINVHLIDVVSGMIIFSMTHRKARAPIHVVHSENWLAYAYYNDKVRRTEIMTVELYEGKTQANNTVWSSLNAPPMPLVERQSYIIPAVVEAMKETITERGITNKDVLIGTANGAIIEMPWVFLDPRRPVSSTTQGREEGAIPYIPELPLPTENFINYNQTIARLSNIYTSPSGLESTCLVVATGLDLFVTRVAPSKTFDLLKEDFDYILITTVLIALTAGSLIAKHLASRKLLKQAWK